MTFRCAVGVGTALGLLVPCFDVALRCWQDGVHDSIEDAKTALALYRAYLREKEQDTLDKTLADVYEYGHINHWKIGHERLQSVQR